MNVAFTPNPPKQGTETIVIQLSDGSRKPVNGANVSLDIRNGGPGPSSVAQTRQESLLFPARLDLAHHVRCGVVPVDLANSARVDLDGNILRGDTGGALLMGRARDHCNDRATADEHCKGISFRQFVMAANFAGEYSWLTGMPIRGKPTIAGWRFSPYDPS